LLTLQVLAVDVHPAARFGRGILLDHGTGVVIGETAVIGNNVSLLQVGLCDQQQRQSAAETTARVVLAACRLGGACGAA
jgi:serine acetyltransferase